MQTNITQVNPAEYDLEINATADVLAEDIKKALKKQQGQTAMKGFRPGRVPLSLVKRMYGKAIAYEVVDKLIQEVYNDYVLDVDDYDVLGQPQVETLEYELDQDLRAVVRFGVRPDFELADLEGVEITKLVHEVDDEDIDAEVQRLQLEKADMVPLDDEPATEEDFVVVDLQMLDDESGEAIDGALEEDAEFFLNDNRVHEALRGALVGKKADDTFKVDLPHQGDHDHDHDHDDDDDAEAPDHPTGPHTHAFEVRVKDVKRRELPELDEAFIQEAAGEDVTDEAGLRAHLKEKLTERWTQRSREYVEEKVVEKMMELHADISVPNSVVEVYLDSFIEDAKRYGKGELPPGFDVEGFRKDRRDDAERQARWMLIRDKLVSEHDLAVTDEDFDAHFAELSENSELEGDMFRQYYQQYPGMMDQLEQRMLSDKVFGLLLDRLTVIEKDREMLEQEMEERRAKLEADRAALAEAEAAAAPEADGEEADDE